MDYEQEMEMRNWMLDCFTWDNFRTMAYGMYVRDYFDAGCRMHDGEVLVSFEEFLEGDYHDNAMMKDIFDDYAGGWDVYYEMYLEDPMIKEVE